MDKKMLRYVAILVGILLAIILILLLKNEIKKPKKTTYQDLEKKVITATKKYTKKNPGVLPQTNGTSITISTNVLVEKGYIKELSSYLKEDVTCSGSVEIYKSSFGDFDYSPNISCGAKYVTKKLADKVIYDNDGDGVLNGMGLYKRVNDKFVTSNFSNSSLKVEYYFRGDVINNYLKIGDNMWRIVGIDNDYNTILIYQKSFRKGFAWDDRYNEETRKNHGINTYEKNGINSRIYETVNSFFNKDADLMDKEKLSPIVKNIIVPFDVCMSSRKPDETDVTGNVECKDILKDQYVSLLPAHLFMNASLDSNCKTIMDRNCGNYNFLASFNDYWWLLTPNASNTSEAYLVHKNYVKPSLCQAKNNVRPVIKISSRVLYSSGDGSLKNPYTIKHFN